MATGAVLTLPGNASASVSGTTFDEANGIAAGTQDAGISAGSPVGPTDGKATTRELVGSDTAAVSDEAPDGWTVNEEYDDAESFDEESGVVRFDSVGAVDPAEDDPVELEYFAEAPEGVGETGRDTFGPAMTEMTIDDEDVSDEFAGTDTNTVVGPRT